MRNFNNKQKVYFILFILFFTTGSMHGQIFTNWGPDGFVKIENGLAGLNATISNGDIFGQDHDKVGDLNGDGVIDLVVGSRTADDGGVDNGAVHILFMNSNGTVQSNQKISMLAGGFTATLTQGNNFGYGVAGIGDYNNDGIPDIAVAAPLTNDQAIYIIHLNTNGTVKSYVKNGNIACLGLTAVGDLNNDGKIDLVACDPSSDIGGNNMGAVRILFFDSSSTVIPAQTKFIGPTSPGFGTGVLAGDQFGGREVAMLGDIDNDGTKEMAVGAFRSDGGRGAIWILSLDSSNLNVVSKLKITQGLNGFSDSLSAATNPNGSNGSQFGHALANVGDLNGDGIPDLMTGANQQSRGYIVYLNSNKTVKTYKRINNTEGGFGLVLQTNERFARSISYVGDLKGDGSIAVTYGGGAGSSAGGTLYLLFLKPCDFNQQAGFQHWDGGNTLFTNWNHTTQMLISDSLTLEQCTFKAFETGAPYMTYNFNDGRCICKDSTATLATSVELSNAFINTCIANINIPLPIVSEELNLSHNNCSSVFLNWTAPKESTAALYSIEKSTDGMVWNEISRIGRTQQIEYKYEDQLQNKNTQELFYRIKMSSPDLQISYSDVVSLRFNCDKKLKSISPNPAMNYVTIRGFDNIGHISLYDYKGALVQDGLTHKNGKVDLSNLSSGFFLLKVNEENGPAQIFKLSIQRQ